jgi:CheY-like chemotaxis protein
MPLTTVLFVEDEEAVLNAISELLRAHGYTVLEARNVLQALETCETYPHLINLLLTDVIMPGMNGVDLAKRVRTLRPHIKVLYTSGYGQLALQRRGLSSDTVHLSKPFTEEELLLRVRQALEASR